jgi:hypothetical protein
MEPLETKDKDQQVFLFRKNPKGDALQDYDVGICGFKGNKQYCNSCHLLRTHYMSGIHSHILSYSLKQFFKASAIFNLNFANNETEAQKEESICPRSEPQYEFHLLGFELWFQLLWYRILNLIHESGDCASGPCFIAKPRVLHRVIFPFPKQ